mgnify:CR=1 FL=1
MKDWEKVKLGEICDFQEGYVNPSQKVPDYFGDEIKWIRANDLNNGYVFDTSRKLSLKGFKSAGKSALLYEPNSIVISKSGTIGKLGIIKDFMCGNRATINIKTKKDVADYKYVFYFLLRNQLEIADMAVGSVQRNLYTSILGSVSLELPPLPEQKAIAATLSCLDDKIELNNRINKTLKEIAQAIFKSWFVDFEPFQDGEFEDSELGRIPKGWRVESLDNIADFLNGLAMQKYRSETDEFLPVIKIRELNQGFTDDSSDKASVAIPEQYIINDGDVIFSWSGTLEVKIWTGEKGALNQHLFKVTSKKYEKWFYHLWTLKHLEKFRAIAQDKATTMGHIRRKDLTESKVLIPKDSDMKFLSNILNPIYEKIIKLYLENRTLKEIRDTLLPKLMSGEIRVAIEAVTTNKQG